MYLPSRPALWRALTYIGEAIRWNGVQNTGREIIENEPWIDLATSALGADWSYASVSPYQEPGYKQDADGFVWLRGVVDRTGGGSSEIFTLPLDHRPAWKQWFSVPYYDTADPDTIRGNAILAIHSDTGIVTITKWDNNEPSVTTPRVSLDAVYFWLDP